ncbi:hypothetical protein HPB51_008209 [Rhipicephalus microplus]|uniref:Uncharacterized protein n=1 Tax=Rhipicephalus microplus TaxID=6941 RepID=A0A9J6D9L6_RHIMP|nr:hypothetical protein HPB51_008209 [Rhipicephalus microplus]
MRVRLMDGRVAGTIRVLPISDDRRLVFDPRLRQSRSPSMGTKPAGSSRPSFIFMQALDEKGSTRAIKPTPKEMLITLLEGFSCFGTVAGASDASTRPVLEERPGVVCVMMKELHQCVNRFRSMGQTCTVVADPFEVHQEKVLRLLCPIAPPISARGCSAGSIFSLKRHGTCTGFVVRLLYNWYLLFIPKSETESDYFHGQLAYRNLVAPKRDQSFVFFEALGETEGNAYAFKRTTKKILTTLLEDFDCFEVVADAGRR